MRIEIVTAEKMTEFGADLMQKVSAACPEQLVIYLHGTLGVGKTTMVRGMLRGLGYDGHVKSPTYTLLEAYELSPYAFYHFDLYRLHDPEELELMGIREYTKPQAVTVFEWPELGRGFIPHADLIINCEILANGARSVELVAQSQASQNILASMQK